MSIVNMDKWVSGEVEDFRRNKRPVIFHNFTKRAERICSRGSDVLKNGVESALKPSSHAPDQGDTNDPSNNVFTKPTQKFGAWPLSYALLAPVCLC